MNIAVIYMIEDFSTGNAVLTNKEACALVDKLDAGKYHPDCWAEFRTMETDELLEPVYGDIGTPDTQDYCIGFEPVKEGQRHEA